jgi:photosystem II stability/assembly factor-like uncharacterized protein
MTKFSILILLLFLTSLTSAFSEDRYIDTVHYKAVYTQPDADTNMLCWYARDIICSDSLNCGAFLDLGGLGARIITTTDGGYTWNIILAGGLFSSYYYFGYGTRGAFLNKDSIFANLSTNAGKEYLRTTNGGATWDTLICTIDCDTIRIGANSFLRNGKGMALASVPKLRNSDMFVTTNDFGKTWSITKSPSSYGFNYCKIISDSQYVLHGYQYFIDTDTTSHKEFSFLTSSNSGNSWSSNNVYDIFIDACFLDSLKGWVLCGRSNLEKHFRYDIIYHTDDGGKTWSKQLDTLIEDLYHIPVSISFADSLHGGAIGISGYLWLTKDGGKTWTLDTTAPFYGRMKETQGQMYISYITPKKFLVLTDFIGRIYMYNEDGFEPSEITEQKTAGNEINIIPNPAEDYCDVIINLNEPERFSITILNSIGEEVQTIRDIDYDGGEYKLKLDMRGKPSGNYFCKLNIGEKSITKQFVISK